MPGIPCPHPEKLLKKDWKGRDICGICEKPMKGKGSGLSKYNAVRTNGFGSGLEAAVNQVLEYRQKAGEIRDLRRQVRVDMGDGIFWNCDFSFYDIKRRGQVWAEAKGVKTPRYRIIEKLWRGERGHGPLEIWMGDSRAPYLRETIIPKKGRS